MSSVAEFPIPLDQYTAISLDPKLPKLTTEQREILRTNIGICRDAIVKLATSIVINRLPNAPCPR